MCSPPPPPSAVRSSAKLRLRPIAHAIRLPHNFAASMGRREMQIPRRSLLTPDHCVSSVFWLYNDDYDDFDGQYRIWVCRNGSPGLKYESSDSHPWLGSIDV